MQRQDSNSTGLRALRPPLFQVLPAWAVRGIGWGSLMLVVAASAIVTKEARSAGGLSALAELDQVRRQDAPAVVRTATVDSVAMPVSLGAAAPAALGSEVPGGAVATAVEAPEADLWPADTRWFNGRPVRPAKTIMMTVTAYSPDARSCGEFADGKTASLHSVWTNNMNLVAADSKVLPLGSMITVPGYADDSIVPVLDRGGAIKGSRLDVLYPTHEIALQWGVQKLPVIVWEYADGGPKDDFRAIRDSRN